MKRPILPHPEKTAKVLKVLLYVYMVLGMVWTITLFTNSDFMNIVMAFFIGIGVLLPIYLVIIAVKQRCWGYAAFMAFGAIVLAIFTFELFVGFKN